MNHDILARLYYSSVYPLVALSGILLIQSQVVSFNQFGSRIKHSCLRIYGVLVCKGPFTTYGDYIVHASRNCTKFVYWSWRSVNCAAAHLCQPKQIMIKQQF